MKRFIVTVICGLLLVGGVSSCSSSDLEEREKQNDDIIVENSQEVQNLKEKIARDEASADKIGYVYIMSFGKFIGYYTIKGKISSNGSQLAPQDDLIRPCSGCDYKVVDGPQDDNTYGDGDPGIFFFTTEGAMVVTDLDYLYADQPIASAIDVPQLNAAS